MSDIQTAKCIAMQGTLAADESTGTIGKHVSSINVENIEANRQALCELLFTSPRTFRYLAGIIPTKSSSSPSPSQMATSNEHGLPAMSARSPPDTKSKSKQLLFYEQKLMPLSSWHKTPENKVQGCVSQVWVRAYLDEEGNVMFKANSDWVLAEGLTALLVKGLSEILQK